MKKDWLLKVYTNYCGTDEYELLENLTKEEAEEDAEMKAIEHAESYSNLWEQEVDENSDCYNESYEEIQNENANWELIEYDSKKHKYLF